MVLVMEVTPLQLEGLVLISPTVHGDSRGHFMEAFNKERFRENGITLDVIQHNHSRSAEGVIRGLHFQWDEPLDKLIRVVSGRAYVVAVDIRKKSTTYKQWVGVELSAENKKQVFMPFGFASGFYAYEEGTELEYYYSAQYNPQGESNIRYDDPEIAIVWPSVSPTVSVRDREAETLSVWEKRPESNLF